MKSRRAKNQRAILFWTIYGQLTIVLYLHGEDGWVPLLVSSVIATVVSLASIKDED